MNSNNANKNRIKSAAPSQKVFNDIRHELRKTHFQLGNDQKNFVTQYKKDYIPQENSYNYGPNMDSVTLRKTHFILGDYKSNYNTSMNDQNRNVDPKGRPVTALNDSVKADLRKSHFILGNFNPNYNPSSKTDYCYRDNVYNNNINMHEIGKNLRKHSHVLGDKQPEYKSEMQSRFQNPNVIGKQEQVVSTAELQKSHYVFGSIKDPWSTTNQLSYGPKEIVDGKIYSKNLTKTNFILGQDHSEIKSVSHQTYVPHKYTGYSQKNKELSQDLRQHHFKFGNDVPSMCTVSHADFIPLDSKNAKFKQTIDDLTLKQSHFTLGDKAQAAKDHFESTYHKAHKDRGMSLTESSANSTLKSSILVTGKNKNSYISESKSNFQFKPSTLSKEEKKQMDYIMKDIRGHHFQLGEGKNDYKTTNGHVFGFDSEKAASARGMLKQDLINDLRSTHYKLGYDKNNIKSTTHMSTYTPQDLNDKANKSKVSEELRKSHFNLQSSNTQNMINNKTIYMTDYTKPIDV